MSPREKSDFANTQKADGFISIHANANDKEHPDQSGFEILLSSGNEKFASQNQVLGSAILQNLKKDFNTASALQQSISGIWVLKNSNMPSALIECGYLTNTTDASNLKDDAKVELIAKNILQGIALYANNAFDKSNLYQIKNNADTTNPSSLKIQGDKQPLYVLDEKIVTKEQIEKLDPNSIASVTVLKDKDAVDKYGNKGKNGVVEILSKDRVSVAKIPNTVLYVLNGKITSKEEIDKLDKKTIESVNILKDKEATDIYGDKGKNGVVEVILKKISITKADGTPEDALYVLNGEEIDKKKFKDLDPNTIESVNVLKDKTATDKYGDKGKNGVIEIASKKN